MGYKRFLNDSDFLALITQEGLDQLIRDNHERLVQAERAAEVTVLEYLRQYYEVENELAKGKRIAEYTPIISYPPGVFITKDGRIYRTLTAINGYRKPASREYWRIARAFFTEENLEKIREYTQLGTYHRGDYVRHSGEIWECASDNGYDFLNIRIPGFEAWEKVSWSEWEIGIQYALYSVVRHGGKFYALLDTEGYDPLVPPSEERAGYWGLIGEYTTDYSYSFGEDDHDYVEYEGDVYVPRVNPNADAVEVNVNLIPDDPRDHTLVTHMTRIALYQLHMLVSPTNVSETRRLQYEDSMTWLNMASKIKIIISIPRKSSKKDGKLVTPFSVETFSRSYDPWQNDWII